MAAMRLTLPRLCDTILIYVKRKGERIVPDWKENKYVKISLCAFAVIAASVLLVLVAMNLGLIMHWLGLLLDIVAPFLWGFFFAYILNYPYKWLLRVINKIPKLSQKMSDGAKRGTAVSVLYAVFIALTGLFFYAVVPQIVKAIADFVEVLPSYIDYVSVSFQTFLFKYLERFDMSMDDTYAVLTEIGKRLTSNFDITNIVSSTLDMALAASVKLKNLFLGLIVSIYFLLDKDKFSISCKKMLYAAVPKETGDKIMLRLAFADKTFGSFFISKVVDSAIIGVMNYIFMAVMKMEYAVLISVLVGVTNVIPFFGPFIGAIPAIFLLVLVNPWHALIFTIFIIILQQFDGNYLGPKLMGDSMGIRAVFVVFAVIVGGGLFGVLGMFIGVPLFVVLYSLFAEAVRDRLKKKEINVSDITIQSISAENDAEK